MYTIEIEFRISTPCLRMWLTLHRVVVLITTIPVYFSAPPYNFGAGQQGLVFLSSCIGNAFGSIFCGYVNDKVSQWSTRRNNGVFEPEMRLPPVIFPAVLVPVGLIMFGVGVNNGIHWIVPVIGVGLVGIALTGIGSIIQPYLMDSYTPVLFDCLVVSTFSINSLSCDSLLMPLVDFQRFQEPCVVCDRIRSCSLAGTEWCCHRVLYSCCAGVGH